MIEGFKYNSQVFIDVIVSPLLPVDSTFPASNIETKKEVRIASGEKINAVKSGYILIVSPELYKTIKKQPHE